MPNALLVATSCQSALQGKSKTCLATTPANVVAAIAAVSPVSKPITANSVACAINNWRRLPPSTRITAPSSNRSSCDAVTDAISTKMPAANEK